jgi:hypothetical protein
VVVGGSVDHALEESAAIGGIGLAVKRLHVDEDGAGVRGVRGDGEGGRVGHQPDLPDRTHTVDAGQVVEHGEGLHRDREADAGFESLVEVGDAGALAADDAIVVAVEEPHQAEARCLRLGDDLAPLRVEINRCCRVGECGRHQSLD